MMPKEFIPNYFCNTKEELVQTYVSLHRYKTIKPHGYWLVGLLYEELSDFQLLELSVGKGMRLTRVQDPKHILAENVKLQGDLPWCRMWSPG
jgi:hypothetical protein